MRCQNGLHDLPGIHIESTPGFTYFMVGTIVMGLGADLSPPLTLPSPADVHPATVECQTLDIKLDHGHHRCDCTVVLSCTLPT